MTAQLSLGGFAPPLNPALSQFHTPVSLCDRIAAWAGVGPGVHVLEPCAGGGNLVRACLALGARVTAVEIDPAWCAEMRREFGDRVEIIFGNFLAMGADELGRPDIVIQNSPYEHGQDGQWLSTALGLAPRVISLDPTRVLHGKRNYMAVWRRYHLHRQVNLVERPIFTGDGGSFDLVVLDVRRERRAGGVDVEWW